MISKLLLLWRDLRIHCLPYSQVNCMKLAWSPGQQRLRRTCPRIIIVLQHLAFTFAVRVSPSQSSFGPSTTLWNRWSLFGPSLFLLPTCPPPPQSARLTFLVRVLSSYRVTHVHSAHTQVLILLSRSQDFHKSCINVASTPIIPRPPPESLCALCFKRTPSTFTRNPHTQLPF